MTTTVCLRYFASALVGLTLALGCGGSDDSDTTDDTGSTGGASGATGGSAGMSTTEEGVPCGQMRCPPSAFEGFEACCREPFVGVCGVLEGTSCVEPPLAPDPSCPSVGAGPIMLTGCCIDGMCGIDGSAFGQECVELGEAAIQAMMFVSSDQFMFPPPQPCGGS